jgi:hypothetical protein
MIDNQRIGLIVLVALAIALTVSSVHDIKNRDKQNVGAIAAFKDPSPTSWVIMILIFIVGALLGGL